MGKTFRGRNQHKKESGVKNRKKEDFETLEHHNFYDDDGNIIDYETLNGDIHGIYKVNYEDGKRSELKYEFGIPVGSYIKYYKSKNKEIETPYVSGKIDGICREWYESGNIRIEYTCVSDMKDGYYREYYETGQKKLECVFIEDIQEGEEIEYNEDGSIKNKTYYENGEIKDNHE